MNKYRFFTALLLILLIGLAVFLYASERKPDSWFAHFPFKLGLDLAGGTELVYKADVSHIQGGDTNAAMDALRDVIERRVNAFGVSEAAVQAENASFVSGTSEHRLIVDLPGVSDINKAIAFVGSTPLLDFRIMKDNAKDIVAKNASSTVDDLFTRTGLTGQYLSGAQVEFAQSTNQPTVNLTFNSQGSALFAEITKNNVGKVLAIFLDNQPISTPVIREEIKDGKAIISGTFSPDEAKLLVRNLNYGALPVPITLVGTQSIGASLGTDALNAGIRAGVWGFLLVALFLILWYRLPGIVATVSLLLYIALSLMVFKLIPVTLTAAGLAGFILSIGMAVDANILIFERLKEEIKRGRDIKDAMSEGFRRAWLSIRDSNISSIITAIVLFWLGTASVKGFALTFGIGVLISMFTAITASRTFLFALRYKHTNRLTKFLFSNGLHF